MDWKGTFKNLRSVKGEGALAARRADMRYCPAVSHVAIALFVALVVAAPASGETKRDAPLSTP